MAVVRQVVGERVSACAVFRADYIAPVKLETLEVALHAAPFRLFELRTDGDVIRVRYPEQVFLAENKTTVIVDAEDRIHIVGLNYISRLTILRKSASATDSKPKA